MGNVFTIAGKIEQARQVGHLRDDVEPLLIGALRLWQKLTGGLCTTRQEQAQAVNGCLSKLEAAAETILQIEEAGMMPVNGVQGNGRFKPVGRVGGEDNESHAA